MTSHDIVPPLDIAPLQRLPISPEKHRLRSNPKTSSQFASSLNYDKIYLPIMKESSNILLDEKYHVLCEMMPIYGILLEYFSYFMENLRTPNGTFILDYSFLNKQLRRPITLKLPFIIISDEQKLQKKITTVQTLPVNEVIMIGVPKFGDDTQSTIVIDFFNITNKFLNNLLDIYAQINPNHFLVDLDRTCEEAYPDWREDIQGDHMLLSLFKNDCEITGAATFERWHRIDYGIMFDAKIKEFLFGLVQRGMVIFVTAGDLVHGTEIVKKMIQHTNLEAYQHKLFILSGRVLGQGAWKSQNLIFPPHIIEKLRILALDDCDNVWHNTEFIKVQPWCPPGFKGSRIHDRKVVYNEYDEERLIKVLDQIDEKNPPVLPLEDPTLYLSESKIRPHISEIMEQLSPSKKRKSVTFSLDLTIHTVPNRMELFEEPLPIQRNKSFDDLTRLDV
jgi:hypothetical protein